MTEDLTKVYTTLSIIKNKALTLEDIEEIATSYKETLRLESMVKKVKETLKDKLENLGMESYQFDNGAELRKMVTCRYDFSDVPEVNELEEKLKRLKELYKLAYKADRSLPDEATGEVIDPSRLKVKESTGYRLKKSTE